MSDSFQDAKSVVGVDEHGQDRCSPSDKLEQKASSSNQSKCNQPTPSCSKDNNKNLSSPDEQEATCEEESLYVVVKKESQDEDFVVIVPPGNQSQLDSSCIHTSLHSHETTVRDKVESDSRSDSEERDSPNHQSLMSIIGKTLPDTDFPSDATVNLKNNTKTKISSASQNVQVGTCSSGGYPILSSSILFQVPITAVNVAKTQGSLVNALSSGQTGVNISSIPLQSASQCGVPSIPVPVKVKLPFAPRIPICNPAITNLNGGQMSVLKMPHKYSSSSQEAVNGTEDKKRKSISNSTPNTKQDRFKKTKLSTEKPSSCEPVASGKHLAASGKHPAANGNPTINPSNQAATQAVWSGIQCVVPHLSPNQVSLGLDQGATSSPNISPTQGRKVSFKYPMKKRTVVTKYRPILPADSGAKIPGTTASVSRTIDSSPKR
ncbi:uncharacterized protein LOC135471340 isoform X2 [Liolophura sinensis]